MNMLSTFLALFRVLLNMALPGQQPELDTELALVRSLPAGVRVTISMDEMHRRIMLTESTTVNDLAAAFNVVRQMLHRVNEQPGRQLTVTVSAQPTRSLHPSAQVHLESYLVRLRSAPEREIPGVGVVPALIVPFRLQP